MLFSVCLHDIHLDGLKLQMLSLSCNTNLCSVVFPLIGLLADYLEHMWFKGSLEAEQCLTQIRWFPLSGSILCWIPFLLSGSYGSPQLSPLVVQVTKTVDLSISIFAFQVALAEAYPQVKDYKRKFTPCYFL